MSAPIPLAIVGGGPAGMAAASAAAEVGVEAVVLDEQTAIGGQIYRNVERTFDTVPRLGEVLGRDYAHGLWVTKAFRESGAAFRGGTAVWEVSAAERDGGESDALHLGTVTPGGGEIVEARHVIVAPGAMERPAPWPGATLPGVMSAGAAQTLLKSATMHPSEPTAIVGSGPLVILVARQLAKAGTPIRALWITTPLRTMTAIGELADGLALPAMLLKGLRWLAEVRAMGVPVRFGVRDVEFHGSGRLERVSARVGGRTCTLEASLALVHEGVVPNAHLTMAAGCEHRFDARQHAWCPRVDAFGRTSIDGLSVAGDGAGIQGADAALLLGRVAAYDAALRLGRIDRARRDALVAPLRTPLDLLAAARRFLDAVFEPVAAVRRPRRPDVLVCRCEEVTVAELEATVALGCIGPNQAKAFTRCGMGPCQGRMCMTLATEFFAERTGRAPGDVGHQRVRPPIKPLTVGQLAGASGISAPPVVKAAAPIRPKQR